MGIGPVQYMVVAFPGNQFKGEIAPALQELVQSGTIRIIDLALVIKGEDGSMSGLELEDAGSEVFQAFESLTSERGGFVSEEDMQTVAGALEPNSSAAVLVWEDVWATRLVDAIANAGGQLVDIERVPRELVAEALAWVEENKAKASA